jgi:hypothetical protein
MGAELPLQEAFALCRKVCVVLFPHPKAGLHLRPVLSRLEKQGLAFRAHLAGKRQRHAR